MNILFSHFTFTRHIPPSPPPNSNWHKIIPSIYYEYPVYWRITKDNLLEFFNYKPTKEIGINQVDLSRNVFAIEQSLKATHPFRVITALLIKPIVAMWLWNSGIIDEKILSHTRSYCGHVPCIQLPIKTNRSIATYIVPKMRNEDAHYEFVLSDGEIVQHLGPAKSSSQPPEPCYLL